MTVEKIGGATPVEPEAQPGAYIPVKGRSKFQNYLHAQRETPEVLKTIFQQMGSPDFSGKVNIEGKVVKLDSADYKTLASITSHCLATNDSSAIEDLTSTMGKAIEGVHSRRVENYFKEAQVRAEYHTKAATVAPEEAAKLYNEQIEALKNIEEVKHKKLMRKNKIANVVSVVTVVAIAAVAVGGFITAIVFLPPVALAMTAAAIIWGYLMGAAAFFGIFTGAAKGVESLIVGKIEKDLAASGEQLKNLEKIQEELVSEDFQQFQKENPLEKGKEGLFGSYLLLYRKLNTQKTMIAEKAASDETALAQIKELEAKSVALKSPPPHSDVMTNQQKEVWERNSAKELIGVNRELDILRAGVISQENQLYRIDRDITQLRKKLGVGD